MKLLYYIPALLFLPIITYALFHSGTHSGITSTPHPEVTKTKAIEINTTKTEAIEINTTKTEAIEINTTKTEAIETEVTKTEATETIPQTFTLAFVGDILIHDTIYTRAKTTDGEYDFDQFFVNVREDIQSADMAICHLETLIAGEEGEYSNYPKFQIPHHIADALSNAGFDGCSIASNHTADGGTASVRETTRHFDRVGMKHTGARAGERTVSPALYQINGKTIAHFSYTYGTNSPPTKDISLNVIDVETIREDVRALKEADGDSFIIVSLHWGDEYSSEISRYQKDIIEALPSEDIHLIIGHHSHVVQPILKKGPMYVFTGLGNFLSAQVPELCNCPEEVRDGVIAFVDITEDGDTFTITDISLVPTIVDFYDFTILRLEKDAPTDNLSQEILDTSAKRTRAVMKKYVH